MLFRRFAAFVIFASASLLSAQQSTISGYVLDPRGFSVAKADKASPFRLSGTVVDTSGAVIAGATVQVQNSDGVVQRTAQSNANGYFQISGVASGNYRLVVSNPGFETKEILVTIGITGALVPLRISLIVGSVSTTVHVQGREDDLIGIAESGTQGTVGATEIEDRPILRSGEVLETVPGLIITQHAGGGKANQYYLRGFNLDHGTDIAIFLDDMPLNLPSHAHGEGYSDMNTVIPEFVKRVNFEKGPYYANVGDFGSAASTRMEFFKTLPQNFAKVEGGSYTYGRAVFGASQKLGSGNLLYGAEETYYDGPWTHPDTYNKINGLITYSQGDDANGFSITAHAYRGKWNSSDQIPVTAQVNPTPSTPFGVGYFGTINPTDGGHSQRYSLQGEGHHQGENAESKISAYLFYYDMDLFSDFTYYLVDHNRGDQFEQQDRRWVGGFDAHHTAFRTWFGRKMSNTFGLQLRNDWINNGLYRTEDRKRTVKTDYSATGISFNDVICNTYTSTVSISVDGSAPATYPSACPTLPPTTERDKFTDLIGSAYVENKMQWANKFRSVVALRGDDEKFIVTSLAYPSDIVTLPDGTSSTVNAANSGSASKFLPSPKASLIFGPWANTEFYLQGGFGFHSNDGRGATQQVEPVSPDNPYHGTLNTKITPLVQTKGGEIGVRTVAVPHLQSTLALWYLRSNSELLQDGDTGGTSASEQSSNRYGLEWANYYTPTEHLAVDFDISDSRAQFTQTDPDDATQTLTSSAITINGNPVGSFYAQQSGPGGKLVPEAVKVVISSGITLHDCKGFSSSLRLRYFGPRDLTSDGLFQSSQTVLLNGEAGYQFFKKWHVTAEFLNMLDRKDADIDYAYLYQIAPTAAPGFGRVNHPTEPFLLRFALGRSF
ncbi:MAG: TonB-dependent receptor [Terracidiphilus sp.]